MSMNISCTRILEFDAAHRVANHESKCATLHGHRYKAEITAQADSLDSIGRVIDFSVLKAKIGTWLDDKWDHTTLVWEEDRKTHDLLIQMPQKKPPYLCPFNPTAENMADYLLRVICPQLLEGTGVVVTKIVLWETPNCKAEVFL